jgi:hypothetical protein
VAKALQRMMKLGRVRETTGKQRHRLFTYHRYLEILNRGTERPNTTHEQHRRKPLDKLGHPSQFTIRSNAIC